MRDGRIAGTFYQEKEYDQHVYREILQVRLGEIPQGFPRQHTPKGKEEDQARHAELRQRRIIGVGDEVWLPLVKPMHQVHPVIVVNMGIKLPGRVCRIRGKARTEREIILENIDREVIQGRPGVIIRRVARVAYPSFDEIEIDFAPGHHQDGYGRQGKQCHIPFVELQFERIIDIEDHESGQDEKAIHLRTPRKQADGKHQQKNDFVLEGVFAAIEVEQRQDSRRRGEPRLMAQERIQNRRRERHRQSHAQQIHGEQYRQQPDVPLHGLVQHRLERIDREESQVGLDLYDEVRHDPRLAVAMDGQGIDQIEEEDAQRHQEQLVHRPAGGVEDVIAVQGTQRDGAYLVHEAEIAGGIIKDHAENQREHEQVIKRVVNELLQHSILYYW